MTIGGAFRERPELRKSRRSQFTCPARISLGNGKSDVDCMVSDISDEGARIAVASDIELPKEFMVSFTLGGAIRCRMVWREGRHVGVRFVRRSSARMARIEVTLDC